METWYPIFWFLLSATALARLVAVVRNPREIVNPLSVVALGFFFVYVSSYWMLPASGIRTYLSASGYQCVLVLATLSVGFFSVGFYLGGDSRAGRLVPHPVDVGGASTIAVLILILASITWGGLIVYSGGFVAFYSAYHNKQIASKEISAYVYQSRYLFYGCLYVLLALVLNRRGQGYFIPIIIILTTYLIADAWLGGRRGEWIMLGVIFAVAIFGSRRQLARRRSQFFIVGAAGVLMFLILVTPMIRRASYFGSAAGVLMSLRTGLQSRNPLAGSGVGTGNELNFASSLVESLNKSEDFDLGKKWLLPFFNFVPRALWPDKPTLHDWSVNYWDLVASQQGWTVAEGAAATGLADAYARFSWVSVFWWELLGFWGGRLWARFRHSRDLVGGGLLSAYLVGLIFFITQGFNNAFLFWVYMSVPVWAAALWGGRSARYQQTPAYAFASRNCR